MTLVTHQLQGSYPAFSLRPLPWSKRLKWKQYAMKHQIVGKTDWHYLLKHDNCLSVGPPFICRPKLKTLRISAFKGNAHNGELSSRANETKISRNSVRLREAEQASTESSKVHDVPLSYTSEANGSHTLSPPIRMLFKKWLNLLRTQPSCPVADEILGDPPPGEVLQTPQGVQNKERRGVLKEAWSYFIGLDATIKIPLLIFIPFYLAVNLAYGALVSKELTPLWVFGPLIVALYIKMFRGLCALYVFSFKQTVKVIKNLPTYCMLAYSYVAQGKLKEDMHARFFQPVLNIKNLDYKELSRRKLKDAGEWMGEKYLDYVESIWPYYCRAIRFLKRANLI